MATHELPNPADILPHRPPMLYVDELTELIPDELAVGLWTPPETEYDGHFPGYPVLPGVKTVEALAQTGAIAVIAEREGMIPLFTTIKEAKFTAMVTPGNLIESTAEVMGIDGNKISINGIATVAGKAVCTAALGFTLIESGRFLELVARQSGSK